AWGGGRDRYIRSSRFRGAGCRPGRTRRSLATMVPANRLERARGTLLGLAVGDALGAPLEGLSPQQIRAHYGQVVDYVDGATAWKKKPYRWRMPGLYSDDTQQALVLADVLLDRGRIDRERVGALYLELATPP